MSHTNSKNNHTPGPWYVEKTDADRFIIIDKECEGRICDVLDVCKEFGPERQKANAALIAAAPDMLEALESLLRVADIVMKKQGSIDCSIRHNARQALAKARGES